MNSYLTLSDETLLSLHGEDDSLALEVLSHRYMKTAKLIAVSLGVPSDEISDYVQEGMIGFLSAVYAYKNDRQTRFSTFACACIKNRILSVLRKSAAKGNIPAAMTVSYEEQSQSLLSELTPEEQFISEKNVSDILTAIDKLSSQERAAFRLYLSDMTYEEIANSLSLSVKAVDSTLQRARKKLRASLSL